MITATTGTPASGMSLQVSPDVSEAARTVVAPVSSFRGDSTRSGSLARIAARSRAAFELALKDPSVPFAVVCALGIRHRAFSRAARAGGTQASKPEASAARTDGPRSIPDGNHGDNTFPIHTSVCEGKS